MGALVLCGGSERRHSTCAQRALWGGPDSGAGVGRSSTGGLPGKATQEMECKGVSESE